MKRTVEQGFSLLEIMIALLVISVGALGLTKAQIASLQTAYDAGLRVTASILVQDMAARIQANAAEALVGAASGYITGTPTACTLTTAGSICTGSQMALHDRNDWNQLIANSFPSDGTPQGIPQGIPQGTITVSSGSGSVMYTIAISWQSWQSRSTHGGRDQTVTAYAVPPLVRNEVVIGGGLMPGANPSPAPAPAPAPPPPPSCPPGYIWIDGTGCFQCCSGSSCWC